MAKDDNKYYSPFGVVNKATGEVKYQEVNPTKDDLKAMREAEKKFAEEAAKNLKTVKVTTGEAASTPKKNFKRKPGAVGATTTPVAQNTAQAQTVQKTNVPVRAVEQQSQQNGKDKEYLVCFTLEEIDPSEPDWVSSRWIKAATRKLAFAKIAALIHDITSGNSDDDFYDPIDYQESFVLCTGVALEGKVSLIDFIGLCLEKEPDAVDKFMLDYLKAIFVSYATGNYDAVDEWVRNRVNTPCTPQYPQTSYTNGYLTEGEDII